MRIFQINCDCGCYSTGKIVSDISSYLSIKKDDNIVAYGRDYKDVGIESVRIGNKIGVYFHALLSRIFDSCGLHSKIATKKIIKKIVEFSPDIIHLHNIHGYYVNYPLLFSFLEKYNKPVVWTLHDCWPFTGHCSHFETIGCNKWKTGCYNCHLKKEYPKSFVDFSRRNYSLKKRYFSSIHNLTLVSPSSWLCELLKKSFLSKYPIEIINNGIDLTSFHLNKTQIFSKYSCETKKVLLGVASTWTKKKGLDDFIKLSTMISSNFQIFLVGLSKRQISKLPKNIKAIEKVFNVSELVELYSSSFVFLNLTYEDTYPTVNLEAQCCGLPVITYRTGGSTESVPESQTVEQGDLRSIVKIIESNKELKLIDVRSFGKEKMVANYYKLYKSILRK